MSRNEEYEGASVKEQLIEACRGDNTGLLEDIINNVLEKHGEDAVASLLNDTTTVLGSHLYHEAASRGNADIIDMLLDQPGFECDPINPRDGDSPLHTAIRWANGQQQSPAHQEAARELIRMMLEAGSSTRLKNKAGLTAKQLVNPRDQAMLAVFRDHELAELSELMAHDIERESGGGSGGDSKAAKNSTAATNGDDDDDDAEFSGSDDEERAEWERQRKARKGRR